MAHWLEMEILCSECGESKGGISCDPIHQRPAPLKAAKFSAVTTVSRPVHQPTEDDLDSNAQGTPGPSKIAADAQPTRATTGRPQRAAMLRARRQSSPAYSDSGDTTSARPIRSSAKAKAAAPKLKLKLSEKAAALAPDMSFLGPYDRELDSDEEFVL